MKDVIVPVLCAGVLAIGFFLMFNWRLLVTEPVLEVTPYKITYVLNLEGVIIDEKIPESE